MIAVDPKFDNLEKSPRILNMLERLRNVLGNAAFDVVDHWPTELTAIGIASPKNHLILVYICACDDGYYAELELPPAASGDSPYDVAARHSGLEFGQLVTVVAEHLSLASKIDGTPKDSESS